MTTPLPPEFRSTEFSRVALADPVMPAANAPIDAPAGLLIRIVCWTIILALVTLEIVVNLQRSESPAVEKSGESAKVAESPFNPTLGLLGRYAVGVHTWNKSDAGMLHSLVQKMDESAKSLHDRIDVAIVSREIELPARSRLLFDRIGRDNDLTIAEDADLRALDRIEANGPKSVPARDRQALESRHGWFGQLALIHGLADSDPIRRALLESTRRTLLLNTIASIVGAVALLVGIVLSVIAIVLIARGRLLRRFIRPSPGTAYLEAFTLYMAGFLILMQLLGAILTTPQIGWTFVAIILLPLTLVWPVIRGEPWSQVKRVFGWHLGTGLFREMAAGVATYVAFLPVLCLSFLVSLGLIALANYFHLAGGSPTHPIIHLLNGSRKTLVIILLLGSGFAPLMEETTFRGALFGHLRGRHGWWASAISVSLIFAAVHPQGWTLIPPLATLSVAFCAIREWRGSLVASMTAHALNNGLVLGLVILLLH